MLWYSTIHSFDLTHVPLPHPPAKKKKVILSDREELVK